jgi:hypothetical protein
MAGPFEGDPLTKLSRAICRRISLSDGMGSRRNLLCPFLTSTNSTKVLHETPRTYNSGCGVPLAYGGVRMAARRSRGGGFDGWHDVGGEGRHEGRRRIYTPTLCSRVSYRTKGKYSWGCTLGVLSSDLGPNASTSGGADSFKDSIRDM